MYRNIKIVKINSDYCDYLRNFDNKVVYNAGNKHLRPFVGILFTINVNISHHYLVQRKNTKN